jgi:PAS domain S-box-containing protein
MSGRQPNMWGKLIVRNFSLQAVLIGSVAFQVLAVTVLTGYISFRNGQKAIHDLSVQLRNQAAAKLQNQINSYLAEPHQLNQIKANAIRLDHVNVNDVDRLRPYLFAQLQVFHSVTNTGIGTPSGDYIAIGRQVDGSISNLVFDRTQGKFFQYGLDRHGNRTKVLRVAPYQDPRLGNWYRGAIKAGKPTWSPIFPWAFKEFGIGLMAAQPVYDETGKPVGVANSGLILDHISSFLRNLETAQLGKVFVIERSGLLVATSTGESPIRRLTDQNKTERIPALESEDFLIRSTTRHLIDQFGDLAQIRNPQQLDINLAGETQFIQLAPIVDERGLDWLLIIAIPKSAFSEQINANTQTTFWLCLIALLLSAGLGVLAARWLALPIHRLSQAVEALAAGDLDYRVEQPHSTKEINALAESFNQMAQQLQASFADLRQSEEKFRQMAENIQEVFWLSDAAAQQCLYISPAFEDVWGRSCESMYANPRSFIDAIHPDDQQRVLNNLVENATRPFEIEYRVVQPNGNIRWVCDRCFPVYDASGKVIRRAGVVQDITESKQAREALYASESCYRQVVETQTDFILRSLPDTTITFANEALCRALGASLEQVIGKKWIDFANQDDLQQDALYQLSQLTPSNSSFWAENRDLRLDGRLGWTQWVNQGIFDERGQLVEIQSVGRDITALKQRVEREQLIQMMTERIRQSLNLDEILLTTVSEVRQVLQTDRVLLFKLEPDGSGDVLQESVNDNWQSILGQNLRDPCFQLTYVHQYFQGRTQATADIDDGSLQPCYVNFLKQFGVRATLIVPIIQTNYLWGLLIAHQCAHPRQWTEDEIQLLKQLADQVAIAIQQADLYRQTQLELAERQRAEAALQQLNQELEQRVQERTQALQQQAEQERLLRLIIQKIHRSLDLEELLATVLYETRQTLQVDRVAIYQFLPDWSGRFVAESVGDGWVRLVGNDVQPIWEDTYLKDTHGGRYQNNESFAVNDIYTIGHSQCHIDLLEQFQAKAYAIAPILLDDQLWGLLAAYQNSGSHHWQDWEISLLRQIGIQMAIALRQAHLYQTAQSQVKELERLHQLKDDFLSTVSHELRSPMTNIKMAIQMMELRLNQQQVYDDRLTQYLQILEEGCSQELALINDLLDLQRLEAGMQSLELESINLNRWLPTIVEPFEARAQVQQQQLNLNLPLNLPVLTTDLSSLKRIMMELLHNACKYTPPHEQITVTVQAKDTNLQIQVSNSGVELPPEELPRLFDKFYRVVGIDRWKHGGTGLGLALVKRLVEHLNGSIAVESMNALTCFTIQLPLNGQFPNNIRMDTISIVSDGSE